MTASSNCNRWRVAVVLALCIGLSGAAGASAPGASITPAVAAMFVDQEKIVEGLVTDSERDASTVRLRLGRAPQTLTVSLIVGLLSKYPPDPERYYLGKTVRVAGKIRRFRGAIEMVIHDPENIEIADMPAGSVAAGDKAAADPAVHENIDALKQRVRELEEQVRQLQHPGATAP